MATLYTLCRRIDNPRIVMLDCNLEYKKAESQTNIEISNEADFTRILQLEEEYIKQMCDDIIKVKPDVVFTEKGVSDLAQHFLLKAGITAIRRMRKTDNNRLARYLSAFYSFDQSSSTDLLVLEPVVVASSIGPTSCVKRM